MEENVWREGLKGERGREREKEGERRRSHFEYLFTEMSLLFFLLFPPPPLPPFLLLPLQHHQNEELLKKLRACEDAVLKAVFKSELDFYTIILHVTLSSAHL